MNRGLLMSTLPDKPNKSHFVQTDRTTHESWAKLTLENPKASALLHVLVNRVGDHNAVMASYPVLAEISGMSVSSVRRAIAALIEGKWIETAQVGKSGTVNAYILNSRVAWVKARNDLRYALFSATVIASETEQPNRDQLGKLPPLHRLPDLAPGEQQLPSGDGLPPPSEPAIPGLEPDLPATQRKR
ncbi:helix-turn-helix domain-containing protein [Haematobacter genomosp. 1]|uniref:Helix-turn-helix domain-containing protein n=2 Tax=Haematobacter genomosp. 1 TaxID=366618 RepID=A0A212A6T7_9RHOB|nr:helix-turn-helix domain-containing protein [Haematobacter genomosp. 1]